MAKLKTLEPLYRPLQFYLRLLEDKHVQMNAISPISQSGGGEYFDQQYCVLHEKKEVEDVVALVFAKQKLGKKQKKTIRKVVDQVIEVFGKKALTEMSSFFKSKRNSHKLCLGKKRNTKKTGCKNAPSDQDSSVLIIDFLSLFLSQELLKKKQLSSRITLYSLFTYIDYYHLNAVPFPIVPLVTFNDSSGAFYSPKKMRHAFEIYSIMQNPIVFNDQFKVLTSMKMKQIDSIINLRIKLHWYCFFILTLHPVINNLVMPFCGIRLNPINSYVDKQFYFVLLLVSIADYFIFQHHKCVCLNNKFSDRGIAMLKKKRVTHHYPLRNLSITGLLLIIYIKEISYYLSGFSMAHNVDCASSLDLIQVGYDLMLISVISFWRNSRNKLIDSTEAMIVRCVDSFSIYSDIHVNNDVKRQRATVKQEFDADCFEKRALSL